MSDEESMSGKTEDKKGAVCAVGMFDGMHLGHRYVLGRVVEEARATGRRALAVTFNRHPLALVDPSRVPASLSGHYDKIVRMYECGIDECVDLLFDEELRGMTACEFIAMLAERYGVEKILMGYDHSFGSDRLRTTADYERAAGTSGVEIERLGRYEIEGIGTVSSSAVRRALEEGDVRRAAQMLGRPYLLRGEVVKGRQIGRTIGFPTANIKVEPSGMAIPREGVYAARATVGGIEAAAMVNIGHNPTVNADGEAPLSIEAHLIKPWGDLYLYGARMTIEFVERIRDERRFGSVEELAAQLDKDRRKVFAIVNI